MDDQTKRSAPQPIIDSLESSVRDIADGNVHDAEAVQAEARRMLDGHKRMRLPESGPYPAKRTRTA